MESGGLGDLFGDPEELQRRLAEFAEQMQGQQRLAWADNAIKLAVDMTVAAVQRVNLQGNADAQAEQIRAVMAKIFPEAVTLVREAREGLQSRARRPRVRCPPGGGGASSASRAS
jgi:CHASE3 domain sensor protein